MENVIIVTDTIPVAGFYRDVGNNEKVYAPRTDDTKEKSEIPDLLLVPSEILKWVIFTHRTPWSCIKKSRVSN